MIDVNKILFELCEDERVNNDNFDLIENEIIDSYAFIELFSILEDYGIIIHPTQISKENLRTPKKIKELVKQYKK